MTGTKLQRRTNTEPGAVATGSRCDMCKCHAYNEICNQPTTRSLPLPVPYLCDAALRHFSVLSVIGMRRLHLPPRSKIVQSYGCQKMTNEKIICEQEATHKNLAHLLQQRVSVAPEQHFLFSEADGRKFTYAEFEQAVDRASRWLASAGVNKGDVVSLLMP